MLRKFTLLTPSYYTPTELEPSSILSMDATAELCYLYFFDKDDDEDLALTHVWSGYKEPFSKEEIAILESGEELEKKENQTLCLKATSYKFYQVNTALLTMDEIFNELFPLIKAECGSLYIRYFKENNGDVITQFFLKY